MMPESKAQRAQAVKREIQVIDRELYHLRELQRRYSRRMLKAAVAIWCAGVAIFFISVMLLLGSLLTATSTPWPSLLILALAAPIVITSVFVRRLEQRQKELERRRKHLMEKFEEAMVKRVERIVKKL